jgi:hypothetical protein
MTQLEADMKLQMPLFGNHEALPAPNPEAACAAAVQPDRHTPVSPKRVRQQKMPNSASRNESRQTKKNPDVSRRVSGLVPEGDVRLTANIRQDLHLRLKIAAAHRRTTIGEIIEEMVDKYIKI